MPVATYDPTRVVVSVGGVLINGFATGTFISVERASETFTKVVGAYGEVARVKSADRSGSMTLTLMQTSNSNAILDGFAKADEQSSTGVVPIQVKDLNSGNTVFAAEAWIRQKPSMQFGTDLSSREWAFELAKVDLDYGGV